MYFPVAGIELNPLVPVLIGLGASLVSSPTGISGGFLILPVSVNFLHFSGLAVSPTNYLFNIISMPPGLWRLSREKRLLRGLGGLITLGSLPGIFLGTALRCTWLKRAADFKVFVALVLAFLALSLLRGLGQKNSKAARAESEFIKRRGCQADLAASYGLLSVNFCFGGENFSVSTPRLLLLSLAIGLVGGIYGIGGAAIIAPLLVGLLQVPVYVAGGASLLAGWAGAVAGLFSYIVFWPWVSGQAPVWPDFRLGFLFGLGGMAGVYCGSTLARFLPPRPLKLLMLLLIVFLLIQNLGFLDRLAQ